MIKPSNPHRRPRLLVVEDEPGDFRLLQLAMQQNGFDTELHGVSSASEAMEFLQKKGEAFANAPRPDLILIALNLPGQPGMDLISMLKQDEHLRIVPVVVLTSSGNNADVSAAYQSGAAGYVVKPADFDEYVAAIRQLGQYWLQLVRLPEQLA